jgi:RNA polymerase sigma-70 factor (ECF subfamily)
MENVEDVTRLLADARAGDPSAPGRLVAQLYAELRRVAGGMMAGERGGHTLQPTALVNEAVLKLLRADALAPCEDRRHVVAAAARAMREVLVDHARRRAADKRGGGRPPVPLDTVLAWYEERTGDLLALNDALDALARQDDRLAAVVTLRFFGGMTVPEVAESLGVSVSTVEGEWRLARAWLRRALGGEL